MNGVKHIGDGEFIVTEEWLCEVFSQAVSMNVADYLAGLVGPLKSCILIMLRTITRVSKREVATILSCEDFNDITTNGSVVVTEKHGTYLKVTDQHWVTVNRFEAEGIRHDADVLFALILEQDCVNVLIDPGHGA